MPQPQPRADPQISQQDPKLANRRTSERRDREQSNPLATRHGSQHCSRREQPSPPGFGERFLGVLVGEADEAEDGSGGEEEERGVEEDETGLSCESVFEEDEEGSEEGGGEGAGESSEGEVGGWDEENSEESCEESHRDVGDEGSVFSVRREEKKVSC